MTLIDVISTITIIFLSNNLFLLLLISKICRMCRNTHFHGKFNCIRFVWRRQGHYSKSHCLFSFPSTIRLSTEKPSVMFRCADMQSQEIAI